MITTLKEIKEFEDMLEEQWKAKINELNDSLAERYKDFEGKNVIIHINKKKSIKCHFVSVKYLITWEWIDSKHPIRKTGMHLKAYRLNANGTPNFRDSLENTVRTLELDNLDMELL